MLNNYPQLYCCCIENCPPRFSSAVPMVPIIAGAALMPKDVYIEHQNNGFIMDDTGDNISSLNPYFGDLTTLYWMWKNADDDFLGTCQYRRPWNEDDINESKPDVLYVPDAAIFNSIEQQYMDCHSVFPAPALSLDLARRGKIPLSVEMIASAWQQQRFHGCNMARGPRELFNKYCELTFETMMPLWEENKDLCMSISGYQRRSIAFAAERLITAIILNGDHFFGQGKVQQARIGFIG